MITVIQAHPVPESFNGALLEAAVAGLSTRETPAVHGLGQGDSPGPVADDLRDTSELWFIYPTWWGGQPAVLLDWIQRTLGPWIDDGETAPSPLSKVTRLVAVTTHGSPPFANRLQGNAGRQMLNHVIRPLCAPNTELEWIGFYSIDVCEPAEREAFVERVRNSAASTTLIPADA